MVNSSDAAIISRAEILAKEERRITAELLLNLRSIEQRRLFAGLGYSSLFDFTVKHLRYSEGAAARRISAMRALRDCGAIGEASIPVKAVEDGRLSVSALSALQGFFKEKERQEKRPVSKEERTRWIAKIEDKPARECERMFASALPEAPSSDRERAVGACATELRFVIGPELKKKLERVRGFLSHRCSNPSYEELLSMLADIAIAQLDPREKQGLREKLGARQTSDVWGKREKEEDLEKTDSPVDRRGATPASELKPEPAAGNCAVPGNRALPESGAVPGNRDRPGNCYVPRSRYVPRSVIRAVWRREGGSCTFTSPESGLLCGSTHRVQMDHIQPFAKGGSNEAGNLRLRCKIHNQWEAIQVYGLRKMAPFLERPRVYAPEPTNVLPPAALSASDGALRASARRTAYDRLAGKCP